MTSSNEMMRLAVPAALFLLAACSAAEKGSEPPFQIMDSSGVRIVRSSTPVEAADQGWVVSDHPSLLIATDPVDPEKVIHWIRGAVRLSDGRIAAISESSGDLRLFDRRGELVQVVGRRGGGPGEFRSPFQLTRLRGDTLVVSERGGDPNHWFSPSGEYLRTVPLDRDLSQPLAPHDFRVGSGTFIPPSLYLLTLRKTAHPDPSLLGRPRRNPRGYVLTSVDGSHPTLLGWFTGWERFLLEFGVGGAAFFARNTWTAWGGTPARIYIGDSEVFDVKVYDTTGALVLIIRDDVPPRRVEREDIEWERREALEFGEQMGMVQRYRRLVEAMPIPDRVPAFEALIVDSDGYLWAKEYSGPDPGPVRYRVYSPEGRRVGAVSLRGRLAVTDIGTDYVLGVHHDMNGIETILLFDLARPGS